MSIQQEPVLHPVIVNSLNQFEDFFGTLNSVYYLLDLKGNILFTSRSVQKVTGYPKEFFIGRQFGEFVHPDDIKLVTDGFKNSLNDNSEYKEFRILLPEGRICWLSSFGHLYKVNGQAVGVHGFINDISHKKKIEDELDAARRELFDSKQMLGIILDNIPQQVFWKDKEYKYLGCNRAFAEAWGLKSTEEIVGKTDYEMPWKEKAGYFIKLDKEIYSSGEGIKNYTDSRTDSSGNVTYQNKNKLPLKNEKGEVIGVVGTIEDVTEQVNVLNSLKESENNYRKLAEELKESERKYQTIFNNNHSISMIIDPDDGRIADVNKAALNYYGYPLEQIKKMKIWDINVLPPDTVKEHLDKASEAKLDVFFAKHRLANGSLKDVEIHSGPILIHGKTFLYSIIYDISDRLINEDLIRKLSKAVEQSPLSVIIYSTEMKVEYVNHHYRMKSGYTFKEVFGKDPGILRSAEDSSGKKYDEIRKCILNGEIWKGEINSLLKDGTAVWEYVIVSPIKSGNGTVNHFIVIKDDITEQKALIEELKQAKEEALEMSRVKSSFLANMSHELRTPMIGILGYAELLEEELEDTTFKRMAQIIHESGKRLLDTLNLVLDLSRIEAKKMDIYIEETDPAEIIDNILRTFSAAAEKKGIKLESRIEHSRLVFGTDRKIFEQILNNLVNNAIKFTDKGAVTIISEIITAEGAERYAVSVADTGIGISEKNQKLIFDEFRQASEGYTRNFEGTGLGLTLTRRFTELLNGQMRLESHPGEGSKFTVILPCSRKAEAAEKSVLDKKGSVPDVPDIKLLLVDDDQNSRSIIKVLLRGKCEVTAFEDADSGINACRDKKFDMLLLDIGLKGGKTGLDVLKEIRGIEGYDKVPAAAFTAFAMERDKELFLASGFNAVLNKPFQKEELFTLIKRITTIAG